jgi:hypothetical protein
MQWLFEQSSIARLPHGKKLPSFQEFRRDSDDQGFIVDFGLCQTTIQWREQFKHE